MKESAVSHLHTPIGVRARDSVLRQYHGRLAHALGELFHLQQDTYSAWALGSAREHIFKAGHPVFDETVALFRKIGAWGAGAGTGGGPGIMAAGNMGHREGFLQKHGTSIDYDAGGVLNLAICLKIGHEDPNRFANARATLRSFDARIGVFTHFGDAFFCAVGGIGTILENFVIDERMAEIAQIGERKGKREFFPPTLILCGREHYNYYKILGQELAALGLNSNQLHALIVDGAVTPSPLDCPKNVGTNPLYADAVIEQHMTAWSEKHPNRNPPADRKELGKIMSKVLAAEADLSARIQRAFQPLMSRFTVCIGGGDGLSTKVRAQKGYLDQAYELSRRLTREGVQVVSPGIGEIANVVKSGFVAGYREVASEMVRRSLFSPIVFSLGHQTLDDVGIRPRLLSGLGSSQILFPGGLSTQTDLWYLLQLNQFMHRTDNPGALNEALKHASPLAQAGGWRPSLYIPETGFHYLLAAEHACSIAKTADRGRSHQLSDAPPPGERNRDGEFQYRRFPQSLDELVARLKWEQAVFHQAAVSHGAFGNAALPARSRKES